MSNFNPKTSIQKYRIFCSCYNLFGPIASEFTRISLLKIKNFKALYLQNKLSYNNIF